jgi:long-chain acyl-CoA synthetase
VHVLEDLPRSQLGKVLRRHVRERLLERGADRPSDPGHEEDRTG